jgi:hypothetical protein
MGFMDYLVDLVNPTNKNDPYRYAMSDQNGIAGQGSNASTLPSRPIAADINNQGYLPSRPVMPNMNDYYMQDNRVPRSSYDDYPTPALDAFYETAMNPPVRRGPSGLRMVGTGLLSALQDSTGPRSRVPTYNEAGKVVGSREAGFWESLGNNPFNVEQAHKILEMPYDAEVEDYKLRAEQLGKAATVESQLVRNRSLDAKRYAEIQAIPEKIKQTWARIGIDSAKAQHYMEINDMTASEKQAAIDNRTYTVQEMQDAASFDRMMQQQLGANWRAELAAQTSRQNVQTREAGATARTEAQQTGALQRTRETITGAMERVRETEKGRRERALMHEQGLNQRAAAKGINPNQLKIQEALAANQFLQENPELAEYISIGSDGFVDIAPADEFFREEDRQELLDIIFNSGARDIQLPPQNPGGVRGGGYQPPNATNPAPSPRTNPIQPPQAPPQGPPQRPPQANNIPNQGGRTLIRDSSGRLKSVPTHQVERFLASPQGQGYTVVK